MKRIKETCRDCGIEFSILSQKGYLNVDSEGEIKKSGTSNSRIFAGTLYQFVIPAKKSFMEESYEEN